ncbi:ABC transporter permease [Microvirga sp. 2MCAF38]|uniref:ABC transporter permease n=1 Tax=Microvirga sp. 2MCAF38 TaxID=3232989 RepID=UPI003F9A8271
MTAITQAAPVTKRVSSALLKRVLSNASLTVGLAIIAIIIVLALFADWIAPFDPLHVGPLARYQSPFSGWHILGTDELGRDILSRLIYGARFALLVAILPTVIALLIGGAIGLSAGYIGGVWDSVVMRVFDVMFAFPGILLALGISAALGPGLSSMIIAMIVVTIPAFGRIVRGVALGIKEELYIEAARTLGYSHTRIALRHILPNVLGPAVVYGTLQTGRNVILSASLSFLGLGPQPPTPEWGQMLSSGRTAIATAAHVATIPGLAIVFLAVGFNLIGDAARDMLDPRFTKDRS